MSRSAIRPGYLLSHRDTVLALVGVLSGLLLTALNQTIVATALPTVVDDLGGAEHYSWVFTSYLLAATVTVPIYGKLTDLHGRRVIFIFGLAMFALGSVIGVTAQSMTQLIVARAVQGLGGGALVPLAFIVVGDLVPASERGRWSGLSGVVIGGASIIGPTLGGWISDNTDWRYVFVVSLPVTAFALVVGWLTLGRIPRAPRTGQRVDVTGAALLVGGLLAALLALSWGGREYAWTSTPVLGGFGLGAVTLACFVVYERRVADPLVPLGMLHDRVVGFANLAGTTVGAAMFGSILLVPLFVQGVMGTSATASGIVLTPLLLGLMVTSLASGQIIARTGRYRWALIAGPVLMGVAFAWLSRLGVGSPTAAATAAMVVMGLGLGLLHQNVVLVVQNAVPSRVLGQATGIAQFTRQMGSTLGVAGLGAVLAARLPGGAEDAAPRVLEHAIRPLFAAGVPLMAVTLMLLASIPEHPLRRTVADDPIGTSI